MRDETQNLPLQHDLGLIRELREAVTARICNVLSKQCTRHRVQLLSLQKR